MLGLFYFLLMDRQFIGIYTYTVLRNDKTIKKGLIKLTQEQKKVQQARKMFMAHMFGKMYLSDEGLKIIMDTLTGKEEKVNV